MPRSDPKEETAKAIAAISSSLKTETRAKMLLALKEGPMRPKDVLKLSTESPSTIYRAVEGLIEAGVISREGDGDKVLWSLTPLGSKLVDSMVSLVSGTEAASNTPRKKYLNYSKMVAPPVLFLFATVRAIVSQQPGWVAGGAVSAFALFLLLRYVSHD